MGAKGGQCCGCGSRLPLGSRWLAASQSLGTVFSSSVVALPSRGCGEVAHMPHTCHTISGLEEGGPLAVHSMVEGEDQTRRADSFYVG